MFGSHLFFILCFFFFVGGGGNDLNYFGIQGWGAPVKISNEEAGHHILRELPIKSHKPPPQIGIKFFYRYFIFYKWKIQCLDSSGGIMTCTYVICL